MNKNELILSRSKRQISILSYIIIKEFTLTSNMSYIVYRMLVTPLYGQCSFISYAAPDAMYTQGYITYMLAKISKKNLKACIAANLKLDFMPKNIFRNA